MDVRCGIYAVWLCACLNALLPLAGLAQDAPVSATIVELEKQIAAAVEKASPAVVAIARIKKPAHGEGGLARLERLLMPSEEAERDAAAPAEFGAGVIVDPKGLVLTTYHLLGNPKEHEFGVWFDRRVWHARVKAADPWFDLALLEVEADAWPAMTFGNGGALVRGQFAISLGNPYVIAREGRASMAWGSIVNLSQPAPQNSKSNLEDRDTVHHYGTLIQTDARLDMPASGGALINLQGEMIGLASGLLSRAGAEAPGGLAIPVDEHFQRTLAMLKEGRVPDYGFLGLAPTTLAAKEREKKAGVLAAEVVPGTPAALAGIQAGDLITTIDDAPLATGEDLIRRISSLHAGATIAVQLRRTGATQRQPKLLTVRATLSKKPVPRGRPAIVEEAPPVWRGMQVDYATAAPRFHELARELDAAGCLGVISVERDSPAWQAGFRPGDFVSHVSGKRVTTPDEFFTAVESLTDEVPLKLATGGSIRHVRLP